MCALLYVSVLGSYRGGLCHVSQEKAHGEELFAVYPRIRHTAKRVGDVAFFYFLPCTPASGTRRREWVTWPFLFFAVYPSKRHSAKKER
jgi:hypothetical protein